MTRILSPAVILVLGAGYVGAKVAELALGRGEEVVLADNWHATRREQAEAVGARVEDCDIREPRDLARVFALQPSPVASSAAQARPPVPPPLPPRRPRRLVSLPPRPSRPFSWTHPRSPEQTNLVGRPRAAGPVREPGRPPLVLGSSLHVYGGGLRGDIDATQPYGP